MPRDLPIGNGTLLAAFDFDYQIRDFYYPRIGKENHALGYPWRFGVWLEGEFSWLSRNTWALERNYLPDALVTDVAATHPRRPLELRFNDVIDYEKNILLRRVRVRNLSTRPLAPRLFFHTDLNALENEIGDTVFFDPKNACLVHYKGPRYFMMSCATEATLGVTRYATGTKRHRGLEGTWRDAEDGELGGSPISQGAVDSVIGLHLDIPPGGEATCHYWMAVGESYRQVEELHEEITRTGPERLLERNIDYWRHWVSAGAEDFSLLPPKLVECYRRSLLILRTQTDNGGAVIAANDTDIRQFNQDTYSYMWPRDGAIVAQALDRAGYGSLSKRFLEFCTQKAVNYNYSASILAETGFLMHKYNPDGSVGSSWQPWLEGEEMSFPIQEDETALVLWALWHHFVLYRDIEFIKPLYKSLIKNAADFMCRYRDPATGLPAPSYDLWEERRGILSYTAGTVFGGLTAASLFCTVFGETGRADHYRQVAAEIRDAVSTHLWREELGRFCRMISHNDREELVVDATCDASLWGLFAFGLYKASDPRITATFSALRERLWLKTPVGGMARYEGDAFYRVDQQLPGNPWFIATLWLADHLVEMAGSEEEMAGALDILGWVTAHALPSGVLAEQVHPFTGAPMSVSPLAWSHATFVTTVQRLLRRLARLKTCPACGLPMTAESRREDWLEKMFGEACDAIHGICRV